MEYYSAIKRNEIVSFAETSMDLELLYRVKSEREKQILYIKCIFVESRKMVLMISFAKQK